MDCPSTNESCKYWENKHGCRTNVHHEYYPKSDYTTPIEKEFRELPENKTPMCMAEHDQLHKEFAPPVKPDREEMLLVINGIRKAS